MNRQPLNVELLTLDDGTQKIAWDVKQLQSLLGISGLLHQEDNSSAASTGVNSSGIPTIETVIAILDELGLKDLYEVRYRKQYATIIPKTDSKRPKVAMYVVQQQGEIALSIHNKIWQQHIVRFCWQYEDKEADLSGKVELYVPPSEKSQFFGRIASQIENSFSYDDFPDLEKLAYSSLEPYKLPSNDYFGMFSTMQLVEHICQEISYDQRFPSTSRIFLHHPSDIKLVLSDLATNFKIFLLSNGEIPVDFSGDIPF